MTTWKIKHADILDWARTYDGPPFHALLCDAPYGLEFMSMAWDSFATPKGSAQARVLPNKAGAFYTFTVAWAEAVKAHLHPGAFMMVFGGSRTYHRMACAIEDAGLIIHPAISWVYGSGFPKATRVKGIKEFEGHRYGLQALKPAAEFICVAQKPYIGKAVECITKTGAGALNIDGALIGNSKNVPASPRRAPQKQTYGDLSNDPGTGQGWNPHSGRWPANLCLDEAAAAALDEQAGERKSGYMKPRQMRKSSKGDGGYQGSFPDEASAQGTYGDTGGASRFFFVAQADQIDADLPFMYCAKASRRERDAGLSCQRNVHPTVKPLALLRWLATLLLPPAEYAPRRILVPFAGSGSECIATGLVGWEEIVGVEREADYVEIAEARLAHWLAQTVMPLSVASE